MLRFITLLIVSNVTSLFTVVVAESLTGFLRISFLSDYSFYSMLLLIGSGTIMAFSGHKVGYSHPNNQAGVVASTLIENDAAKLSPTYVVY
ncbi:hypothetical protein [Vibrio splendidus]|uniref:hypothetical protein n=1 Tax=Vibrio splendidus TaxID=29497 RepID=UPI000D33ACDB|nr:hypothetical protein [Vibrio splendidus]PTP50602.1 hypothetical protein CWO05_19825 [Vibrio splendidus]